MGILKSKMAQLGILMALASMGAMPNPPSTWDEPKRGLSRGLKERGTPDYDTSMVGKKQKNRWNSKKRRK